jgi:hypothetical protein
VFGKGKDWHKVRSTHASVLESLEQVIARHPANSSPSRIEFDEPDLAGPSGGDAVVLPFRPRLSLVRSTPDGAA